MDLQLIAIAVAVIIIVVILLACYVLGTRERTFEDALAEQKGLGILLSSGQAGKAADKHKDKHKVHHDTGGGTKKKSVHKVNESATVTSITTTQQQKPVKKDEKEKLERQRSTASSSAEERAEKEKEAKQQASKEATPIAIGGSESSRSRHSSSGENTSTLETSDAHGKKQKRQQQQQSVKQGDEVRDDVEEKVGTEPKGAKKATKKKRRADGDEVDASLRSSTHEDGDQAAAVVENGDAELKKQDGANGIEDVGEQQAGKKSQKKKQKSSGKQHHEDDGTAQDNKENVEESFEKSVITSVTSAAPAKQKPGKPSAASKPTNQDDNNLDVIIEQLKTSSLNHTQLEFVLNVLLNKQEQGIQVSQKPDQLSALKKQLEDKEKALVQETQLAASVNQKLKELRQQLDSEKSRHAASERTYQEQVGIKQRDLQASQQKIQELQAQCGQLSAQSRQAQDQLLTYRKALEQAPNPTQIQQLRDENQRLKEHLTRNEQETHARSAEVQRLRQDLAQRESQLHQSEQRFLHLQQSLSMQENNQVQHVAEYQQKLAAKDLTIAQLEQDLANVRREWSLLETSVRELRQQSSVSAQAPVVERNVRLQNSQQVDNDEGTEKLKAQIDDLKAAKDNLNRDLQASKSSVADLEKRIKDLDKELKEAQSASKRQVDASQTELRQLKDALEKAQREHTELKTEHTRITTSSKANSEKIEKLEKAQTDLRHQLETEKKARSSADAEISKVKSERDNALKALEESKKAGRSVSAAAPLAQNAELRHFVFEWLPERDDPEFDARAKESVKVTGTFWGWDDAKPMKRVVESQGARFILPVDLPSGRHEFKFVVERENGGTRWLCSRQYAVCADSSGVENNYVDVEAAESGIEETITLKHQVQHLQSSVSSKDKDVEEWKRRSSDFESKTKGLESDLEKLKEDRRNLEVKVQNLQQENTKLSEQAALASHNGHSDGASADALKIQELSLTHLNKQLITKDGEIVQLKQQLDQQRQKNAELRERNQKVVEAMNQLEKTSKEMTQKVEKNYQKQLEDQEKQTKQLLAKIIPDVKIPEKETFFEWIKEVQRVTIEKTKTVFVEKNVTTSQLANQDYSKQLEELKKENAALRARIDRFGIAFKEAESEFKLIEDHAAKQEKMWRERVAVLEKELAAKSQAGHSVDLTSASAKDTKEIEVKLITLHSSLEKVEHERTTYKTELERLRVDLETERVGARDLSSQVVKLRGMLKTGQDALKQEQDTVAQLQKQLKAFQANASASSNDAKEGKGEQQLHDELKEIRTKLTQREQQLEREMMINKQLNNKLASLGVASPSPASVGSSNGSL